MKKINIFLGLIFALNIIFPACTKDFLELEPKTNQMEANFYKTEDDAFLAVAAVYDALSIHNWAFVPTMSDVYSDDAFCGGSDAGDMRQWHDIENHVVDADNAATAALWSRCYSGIYRTNIYLQKQDGIEWKTSGLKQRFEAEVKFARAYFYWDLARHYGWVPIITQVYSSADDYKNLPQNTPDEVYTQVATDLLAAIPNLPSTVPASEAGRVTKYAAEALLARIYLFHEGFAKSELGCGNWTNGTTTIDKTYAATALEDIINNGPYELLDNYADVFAWDNENNAESIFELQYSEKSKVGSWDNPWAFNGNLSTQMYGPRNPEGDPTISTGWSIGVLTWSLINEFEPGDPRYDATVYDANLKLTKYTKAFQNTGYFNKKYMGLAAYRPTAGTAELNWPKNYIDIRFADVLLMAAELNLGVDDTKALNYLNMVRERAMGTGTGLLSIDLDAIYHERRVELSGEGHRKWDLLRRGLDFTKAALETSFDYPDGIDNVDHFNYTPYKDGYWGMLPIPANEFRTVNPGSLKQYVPAYQ